MLELPLHCPCSSCASCIAHVYFDNPGCGPEGNSLSTSRLLARTEMQERERVRLELMLSTRTGPCLEREAVSVRCGDAGRKSWCHAEETGESGSWLLVHQYSSLFFKVVQVVQRANFLASHPAYAACSDDLRVEQSGLRWLGVRWSIKSCFSQTTV